MRNYTILSAVATLLIACGGGDGSVGAPTAAHSTEENIRYQLEIISTTASFGNLSPQTDLDISFLKFPNFVSASQIYAIENLELGCKVKRQSADEYYASGEILESELVSAGEVLTITSPAGTWAELQEDSDSFYTGLYDTYSTSNDMGMLPMDSTMDVPGDTFPQVSDIVLLTPELLTNVEFLENGIPIAQSDLVTPNTTILWDKARTSTNSMIIVSYSNIDSPDFSTTHCFVEDTGRFEFPANIRALMDESYASHHIGRLQQRSEQRGNVLITQYGANFQ